MWHVRPQRFYRSSENWHTQQGPRAGSPAGRAIARAERCLADTLHSVNIVDLEGLRIDDVSPPGYPDITHQEAQIVSLVLGHQGVRLSPDFVLSIV